jgi:glutamyl-tRNA synthetase
VHLLLWKYLGWKADMPKWAHLPLILKPDGHGKLSKRDGARLGFPVFALDWQGDAGYNGMGFLPQAFVNMLATLGWNDGSGQELFNLDELVQKFSLERISKAGAKFDFEKAKWFNAEWIKKSSGESLLSEVKKVLEGKGIAVKQDAYLLTVINLIKDRCTLLTDFYDQSKYFFEIPQEYDLNAVKPKWTPEKTDFFKDVITLLNQSDAIDAVAVEEKFKALASDKGLKPGDVMLPFRIMLVGGKFGPHVFDIAALIGKEESVKRINAGVAAFTA